MKLLLSTVVYLADAKQSKNDCILNYRGKTSTTKGGYTCQKWSADYPHEPKYQPKGGVNHNFCRNPDKDAKGPWCYTTDPEKRFDYCDISDCFAEPDVKCWRRGHEFHGKVSKTKSGRKCQSWVKNHPHKPNFRPRHARQQKNYCRNPDDDEKGPWCYTTDPKKRFEYCDIPECDSIQESEVSEEYEETMDFSESYEESYEDFDIAALLGLLGVQTGGYEYYGDYEEYSGYDYNNTAYEDFASDKVEHIDCQTLDLPEPGSDYVGDVSVTASGRKCQNWLDQVPHKHEFTELGNHNSCRNLHFSRDDAPQGIWCYTTDPKVRWEFCSQVKGNWMYCVNL